MARSSVLRAGFAADLDDLLAQGATIDEITEQLNAALERAGKPERLSRSAVGRAAKSRQGILAAKRRADLALEAMREAGPPSADLEGRLELVRTLLVDTAARALAGDEDEEAPPTPGELKDLARTLLSLEQAGHLADRRIAEAERREREAAARRGEQAARRQGLSAEVAAAIHGEIEGAA